MYGITASKLKDFSTSKKDMKRGVEIPLDETYRLRGEDRFQPRQDFDSSKTNDFGKKGGSLGSASTTSESSSISGGNFGDDY